MRPLSEQAIEATQHLLDCVASREPDSIRFTRDPYAERQITFYLANQQYRTVIFCYGHRFTLALLHLFEEQEAFEDCEKIVEAIREFNALTKSNLKTR